MKSNKKYNYIKGFTLIEIMVSVSIFTVIITTGIGALVSIVNTYSVTQNQKKVHDGLNYALESMTREMRLGRNYYRNPNLNGDDQGAISDGAGESIGFDAADSRGYVIYYVDNGVLMISRDGVRQALTDSSQLIVEDIEFYIIGTSPLSDGNYKQPLVWIRIKAQAQGSDRDTVIQSFVSQRTLDV